MVAIKGLEMPKNCIECNHMDLQQAINCQHIFDGCANCGRHPKCPLIEINELEQGFSKQLLDLKSKKLEKIEQILDRTKEINGYPLNEIREVLKQNN